jgi:putative membrane protein
MRRGLLVVAMGMIGLLCGCTATVDENRTANANTNANANAIAPGNANAVAEATPARGVAPRNNDNEFVHTVAMDGMAEVELARLASQKAKSPEVKKFAQRMLADHSKANEELKQLASNKNITLPTALGPEQDAEKNRLANLSGAEFDREYMSMMSAAHDRAVNAFEDESRDGGEPDIKAWAAKILPTLREHQSLAKDISSKITT